MTEDRGGARVSSGESNLPNDAAQTRQRKKRKWDQPAESLASVGATLPTVLPIANLGVPCSRPFPGIVLPVSGVNPVAASSKTVTPLFQALPMHQQAALVPKVNQPKIQEELTIAREIVINDAEASIRYKLTKRQTQEEIQRCTGAVVITRGKYLPPNTPPDGEKPLYLHISAGSHLKETAERILAVDRAAAMVEEMIKQSLNSVAGSYVSQTVDSLKPWSSCLYLGFEADPSLNVADRIRGPNDQYINHIMNETGATVVLRGRGSGNLESQNGEEAQQPVHLLLSSSTSKSLEDAKHLAENLLDTISLEFGASRVPSRKVYRAVPPPQQLLAGVQGSENEQTTNSGSASPVLSTTPPCPASSFSVLPATAVHPRGPVLQPVGMLNGGQSQPFVASYPQPLTSGGTSYSGYAGIYPQVTPLQQVALALRQSTAPVISTVSPAVPLAVASSGVSLSLGKEKERQPPQKRKFQELPVGSKGLAKNNQVSEPLRPVDHASDLGVRNTSTMPAPRKLVQSSSNRMLPPPAPTPAESMPLPPPSLTKPMLLPPPRSTLLRPPSSIPAPPSRSMPPAPPKFTSSVPPLQRHEDKIAPNINKVDLVPDTLVKLMEYRDDDDDDLDETPENSFTNNSSAATTGKPFWAV